MASLKDLCTNVPKELLNAQTAYNAGNILRTRKSIVKQAKHMERDTHVFDECKQARPNRTKYRNTLYREQAGTMGNYVRTVRVGEYITNVCSSKRTF